MKIKMNRRIPAWTAIVIPAVYAVAIMCTACYRLNFTANDMALITSTNVSQAMAMITPTVYLPSSSIKKH